jgi:hypothetical protein
MSGLQGDGVWVLLLCSVSFSPCKAALTVVAEAAVVQPTPKALHRRQPVSGAAQEIRPPLISPGMARF